MGVKMLNSNTQIEWFYLILLLLEGLKEVSSMMIKPTTTVKMMWWVVPFELFLDVLVAVLYP